MDLNEARMVAEAANASKSAFLANMSHEIRTPMTAILGYAELLKDSIDSVEAIQYLQTIQNNGSYLLEIINDILDLSKIEAGKLDAVTERFEPYRLIEDVRSIMEVRAKESGLTLEVCYETKLPKVIQSDAKRLKQILINLVGNAIKFTLHGKVQIKARFDTGHTVCNWILSIRVLAFRLSTWNAYSSRFLKEMPASAASSAVRVWADHQPTAS